MSDMQEGSKIIWSSLFILLKADIRRGEAMWPIYLGSIKDAEVGQNLNSPSLTSYSTILPLSNLHF